MKNQYRFENLNRAELPSDADEAEIFFSMRDVTTGPAHTIKTIDELEGLLGDGFYYVASNHVVHKGKSVIFRGRVVMAEKAMLLLFLREAAATGDLRPLLIAPKFISHPEQVIFISEDECHLYLAAPDKGSALIP